MKYYRNKVGTHLFKMHQGAMFVLTREGNWYPSGRIIKELVKCNLFDLEKQYGYTLLSEVVQKEQRVKEKIKFYKEILK